MNINSVRVECIKDQGDRFYFPITIGRVYQGKLKDEFVTIHDDTGDLVQYSMEFFKKLEYNKGSEEKWLSRKF